MALIGTIRKNGWILIVAMALALGGFILMDVVSNSQRYSAADVNLLGKVAGAEIKRSEFETYQQLVYSDPKSNTYQVRNQAWTYFTEKAVIEQEAEALGLGVSKDELLDLQFGVNISPIITERFQNPDGQPNRAMLAGIKNAIETGQFSDPKNRAYWAVQEKEVVKARLQEKFVNAIGKGMYTPSWQAEMVFKENNERRDFRMVRIGYDKVKDEEAQVADSDYEALLSEYPHLYDQAEESRVVSYVTFDVVPTSADTAAVQAVSAKILADFRAAKEDSTFVIANEGFINNSYIPKDNFPAKIRDSVMTVPLGTILGPVLDKGEWRVIKVLDRKTLPDSVNARHILLRDATPENGAKADSLITLIKSGKARFDSLAMQVSADGGSARKGGDLGWFTNGAMVPEFNEVCFITGEQGKLYKVSSQFGWHIIEILGKKFIKNEASVKAAIINRRVEPSKPTQQAAKDKAVALIQQAKTIADLETLAGQQNIPFLSTPPLKINDYSAGALGVDEDAREIIRWAYGEDVKVGSVGGEVFAFGDPQGGYFDNKYVVAALKSIVPKGKTTVSLMKSLPEAQQRVKNLKKASILTSRLQNAGDISALAAQWTEGRVDTIRMGSFMQSSGEPRVAGVVFSLETGKVSEPIVGNNGIYVVQPLTDKTQQQMPADMTMFRRQVTSQSFNSVRTNMMKTLLQLYGVEDHRDRFW
ncbi:MAG: peptidylprolyl isomerase [Saprospiraceae bacterium]|nr:peptidylprolyl isomerase [Saprospiraceae bacterium]